MTKIIIGIILVSVCLNNLYVYGLAPKAGFEISDKFIFRADDERIKYLERKKMEIEEKEYTHIGDIVTSFLDEPIYVYYGKGWDPKRGKNRYILYYKTESGKMVGYVRFDMDSEYLYFAGMYIHADFRKAKLMKKLFTYFLGFGYVKGLGLKARKQRKPLFAKMLLDFGFTPLNRTYKVFIEYVDPLKASRTRVFMPGRGLKRRFVISQRLDLLLEESKNGRCVFVKTGYVLRPEDEDLLMEEISRIEGTFFYYYDGIELDNIFDDCLEAV